jgi:hypothetical protein
LKQNEQKVNIQIPAPGKAVRFPLFLKQVGRGKAIGKSDRTVYGQIEKSGAGIHALDNSPKIFLQS